MDKSELIRASLAVVILMIVFGLLISGYSDCRADGGEYIRGLFWMKCVK